MGKKIMIHDTVFSLSYAMQPFIEFLASLEFLALYLLPQTLYYCRRSTATELGNAVLE